VRMTKRSRGSTKRETAAGRRGAGTDVGPKGESDAVRGAVSKDATAAPHRCDGSLDCIFRPKSIAIVGASRRKGRIGYEILHNLVSGDYNGKVFPVNPEAEVIHSIKCYPSVSEVPDAIDMAVIVVPSAIVPDVVDECGRKGVKGLVIISAGFRETGQKGAQLEDRIMDTIRKHGMRMVGPNCMGVICTDPAVSMNATFARIPALRGRIGFMSQSGALGEAILEYAQEVETGFSVFASVGNKADVSGNDLMEYWENDPNTEVILLYLESFGNPRRFKEVARRISRTKPVVAVKAGTTFAGARAASSHTGALVSREVATDALFEQCGVIRVTSIEELFDVSSALANQPLPKGDRVAIVTNAGGPGILATDACVNLGMKVEPFSEPTMRKLAELLPTEASVQNPVDMIASAGPEQYRKCLKLVLDDPKVDALIVIFVSPVITDPRAIAEAVIQGTKGATKPVLACFMGNVRVGVEEGVEKARRIPFYIFPESAARSLVAMEKYKRWREKPEGTIVDYQVDKKRAAEAVKKGVPGEPLDVKLVWEVLEAYGLPVAKTKEASSGGGAVEAAEEMGYPVVMKVSSPRIMHKTDVGGVIRDIRSANDVVKAFASMRASFPDAGRSLKVAVQPMIQSGREVIIGVTQDPSFGPLIMFGLGGIFVETLRDVSFRIHPITDVDAVEMMESIRGRALLEGARGERPIHKESVIDALLRVSQLVTDLPGIKELDINPFMAHHDKSQCKIVDAKMVVG
jgi:acetyl coenzyme A synthetase (ADP forming)-like protein